MKSLELFAGGGGLGLGLGLAGFHPERVVEWDRWCCDTIRSNKKNGYPLVQQWEVFEGNIQNFSFKEIEEELDLISGGPPCQPFSLGGKHRGNLDRRDMFPVAIEAVRSLKPRAFVFENVKGITRASFANYFQYIQLQLAYPQEAKREGEPWICHLERLEEIETRGGYSGLSYNVVARVLNAADYGVPQRRERVFVVGFRNDQMIEWSFPIPTHSKDVLVFDQWGSGEYWERHKVPKKLIPECTLTERILHSVCDRGFWNLKPWKTVRDALNGLPHPRDTRRRREFFDHTYQPGARVYPGHTGSSLDLPAKTLKAGDHGVPGGENMLVNPDGSVRYFTVRESARLQTFPDGYRFHGSWTETMRQLGNAVPVKLAQAIGTSIATKLLEAKELRQMSH